MSGGVDLLCFLCRLHTGQVVPNWIIHLCHRVLLWNTFLVCIKCFVESSRTSWCLGRSLPGISVGCVVQCSLLLLHTTFLSSLCITVKRWMTVSLIRWAEPHSQPATVHPGSYCRSDSSDLPTALVKNNPLKNRSFSIIHCISILSASPVITPKRVRSHAHSHTVNLHHSSQCHMEWADNIQCNVKWKRRRQFGNNFLKSSKEQITTNQGRQHISVVSRKHLL